MSGLSINGHDDMDVLLIVARIKAGASSCRSVYLLWVFGLLENHLCFPDSGLSLFYEFAWKSICKSVKPVSDHSEYHATFMVKLLLNAPLTSTLNCSMCNVGTSQLKAVEMH